MSTLPLVEEQQASHAVAAIYDDIKRGFEISFVPNFFKGQAASPDVLSATWHAVRSILVDGKHVPRSVKEMIFVAVSDARQCDYCETAHLAFCQLLGVEEEKRTAILEGLDELAPKRTRDVLKFATKVATEPRSLTDKDYEIMKAHRISDAELMEIIAMASLATFATILADALQLEIDGEFREILAL